MYYIITKFFIIFCSSYWMRHQCYGSENFPDTNMLLKLNHFERFLNWNNIEELVINTRVDVTETIMNLLVTITNLTIA